jgi:virginiamycin A acetyltransferase
MTLSDFIPPIYFKIKYRIIPRRFKGVNLDIGFATHWATPEIHGKGSIKIGKFCSFGHGLKIILSGHRTDFISTYRFGYTLETQGFYKSPDIETQGKVTIGNDVWIGMDCTILAGANIGDGAIIGAGSAVRGKIPPYTVAIGNPAKVLYYRFSQDQVAEFESLKWWDWHIERINLIASALNKKPI